MEEGKIKGSVYFGPGSLGDDTNKTLIDYLPEIDEIDGDFICADNGITSLTEIYEKIKSIKGYADFSGNKIQHKVLGLLKINNLKAVYWDIPDDPKANEATKILNQSLKEPKVPPDYSQAPIITNRYLEPKDRGRDISAYQEELIDANLKDYAEL